MFLIDRLRRFCKSFAVSATQPPPFMATNRRANVSVLKDFRNGKSNILIATDVASRGLDVLIPLKIMYIVLDAPDVASLLTSYVAYTFFTPDNGKQARELISVLEEAGQTPPQPLLDMARSMKGNGNGRNTGGDGNKTPIHSAIIRSTIRQEAATIWLVVIPMVITTIEVVIRAIAMPMEEAIKIEAVPMEAWEEAAGTIATQWKERIRVSGKHPNF